MVGNTYLDMQGEATERGAFDCGALDRLVQERRWTGHWGTRKCTYNAIGDSAGQERHSGLPPLPGVRGKRRAVHAVTATSNGGSYRYDANAGTW